MLLTIVLISTTSYATSEKKVLIIASNMIDMGDPEKHDARNNLWEFAPPYHVFLSHGFDVDFVSPLGGEVKFMMEPQGISSYTIKYEGFMDKANSTLKPAEVVPEEYWGVFIGGGYGAIALNKRSLEDKHAVVTDARIVSTMFLPSAALVAKEMIIESGL